MIDDVTEMTSKLIFLKFGFVLICLKNHNLEKSPNFRSPKLMVKERWL